MPSATPAESPTHPSGKKRRWNDNVEARIPSYGLQGSTSLADGNIFHGEVERIVLHNTSPGRKVSQDFSEAWQRKIRPLPSAKRIRISEDGEDLSRKVKPEHQHSNYSTPPISPQIRPQTGARTSSPALLNPCHICHRKPTKRSELDSFANCQGCGQRTCYVCMRQCQGCTPDSAHVKIRGGSGGGSEEPLSRSFTMQDADDEAPWDSAHRNSTSREEEREARITEGWNAKGHVSVVCSRCCVERGSEGDVVCLGCLAHMAGT